MWALANPNLTVYAFEPNLSLVAQLAGRLPNYVVVAMGVSDREGFRPFYLNSDDATSSLLPFSPEGLRTWRGGEELQTTDVVSVPTIRLDTFLLQMKIEKLKYLKVDAQGHDLEVIRSLGERIQDVERVQLEVNIAPVPQYEGSHSRREVVEYMESRGFELVGSRRQSLDQELNLTFLRRCV